MITAKRVPLLTTANSSKSLAAAYFYCKFIIAIRIKNIQIFTLHLNKCWTIKANILQ
jgi:hypothetical protein